MYRHVFREYIYDDCGQNLKQNHYKLTLIQNNDETHMELI